MNLKARLGRLGPGVPGHTVQSEPYSATLPSQQLQDLRETMAHMVKSSCTGDSSVPERAIENTSELTNRLPFEERVELGGSLCQRLEIQPTGLRVGRVSIAWALESNPRMLSLLALAPEIAECSVRDALYFDTETTGLGGAGTLAFLVGFARFNDNGELVLEQLLLRDPADEVTLLARVVELMTKASMLVSFNGKSFDLPLLKSRCVMNKVPAPPKRPHMDLLHVGRRLHKRRLKRCKLIDLEREVLGFERSKEDIPGAEIPPLYGHFLRTGDESGIRSVVDHNAWDVLSMVALVGLYGKCLDSICTEDLSSLSTTFMRAKALEYAEITFNRMLREGDEIGAVRLRARMNKHRGEKSLALRDYRSLNLTLDDDSVRFELVKLLEHHAKDFEEALTVAQKGTGECRDNLQRRQSRLSKRIERVTNRDKRCLNGLKS